MTAAFSSLPSKLVFVDTETTGTNSYSDRIIEISLIQVENGRIVDTFNTLVNPEIPINPFITGITGISSSDLISAPTFAEIKNQVKEILKDSLFIAHNARFDYGFIKREFKRYDELISLPTLCTVRLSRTLYPSYRRHNLDSLIERFNLSCTNRHRAYDDAHVLFQFFEIVQNNFPSDILDGVFKKLIGASALPIPGALRDELNNLPSAPGIYTFYSADSTPLYIGKSKDLKHRVISHFYDSINVDTDQKLALAVDHFSYQITPGEFSALILESRNIKTVKPLHNRRLRQDTGFLALKQVTTADGYFTVEPQLLTEVPVSELNRVVGIFKNKKQLQSHLSDTAKNFNLCPKLLGLESGPGSCFSYHLGTCLGACKNLETSLHYNLRFLEAFSPRRLMVWPFPGPVIVTENNPENDSSLAFIIDNWCLLEIFDDPGNLNYFDYQHAAYSFDYDLYHIFKRHLLKPHPHLHIKHLKLVK